MGKKSLLFFYNIWVALVFTTFMLILFPFMVIPISLYTPWAKISFIFVRWWAYIFSKLTFIKYKIYGKEHIKKGQPYIFTCNHSSYLDSPAIPLTIPGAVRILAKKELVKIPVLGFIIKAVVVVVDRSSNKSRQKSMAILKKILSSGTSIFIFPEGTMNRTDRPLNPFYDGAFRIAIDTQTPIMPMVIINSGKLLPPSGLPIKQGTITVKVCGPVEVKGLTYEDIPEIKQKVFLMMEKEILKGSRNAVAENETVAVSM